MSFKLKVNTKRERALFLGGADMNEEAGFSMILIPSQVK